VTAFFCGNVCQFAHNHRPPRRYLRLFVDALRLLVSFANLIQFALIGRACLGWRWAGSSMMSASLTMRLCCRAMVPKALSVISVSIALVDCRAVVSAL